MSLRGKHIVPNPPLLLLILLLPAVAMAGEPGKILPDTDGAGAVVLRFDGTIEHIDMAGSRVTPIRWPGQGARPVDIARPGKGSVIYTIVPQEDGKTTILEAHDVSGEAGPTMELKGRGRFLEVTEDGRFACVAATKPGSRDDTAERWILIVVDIATGEAAPPIPIGLVPKAMAVRGRDGILARLFIAGEGRVATFSMVPPRPSWFYRSPGVNHDIALPAASPVVCVLRGQTFAVIDPQRWERDEGRVRSSTDDATTIVNLEWQGGSIAMSPDGRFATVLAPGGLSIAVIDVAAGKIDRTMALQESADLAARVMTPPDGDAGDARLLLATRATLGSKPTWLEIPAPAAPPPGEVAAAVKSMPAQDAGATADSAGTAQDTGTAAAGTGAPAQDTGTAAKSAAPSAQDAGAPAPAESAEGKNAPASDMATPPPQAFPKATEIGSPAKESAEPPAATAPAPADVAPEPPAVASQQQEKQAAPTAPSPPSLSGHIQGEIPEGLHVLLYGPDNVLRPGPRVAVGADGVWRLPIPAPGRYRVVVSAGSERHVFVSPEYRTIVITGSGESMNDIDFEIRGSLQ